VRSRPPLLALTVHQPWAWALAGGWKPCENRDWPPPPSVLGHYLAIHAGRQYDEAAARELVEHAELLRLPGPPPGAAHIALGAIVAVGRVAGAVLVDEVEGHLAVQKVLGEVPRERAAELARSPWASGPWLWVLDSVVQLAEPVPCRGLQKVWTVPPPVADVVRERYRAARRAA
jgi:hypothetical protein